MSVTRAVLSAFLCALVLPATVVAQEFQPIFNGVVGERRVVAVAVRGAYYIGDLIDDLRPYAAANTTLLAYINHEAVSETEPLVVYVDGENVSFAEAPRSSSESPTFEESMQRAMLIQRGEKTGAICRDGTQTTVTNNGACSFNGGLDRWVYEAVARSDADQVVAAICNDYRLVSGDGRRCGEAGLLTQIQARLYPAPQPVDPASLVPEEEGPPPPSEREVAPLPEPDVVPPVVEDSGVEWTSRVNGRVRLTWTTLLSNPNDQPVRALVTANLRDSEGEVLYSDDRYVALGAGDRGEFSDDGQVEEEIAMRGARWTFDVALTEEDAPLTPAELEAVLLLVDPIAEEVHITNLSDSEIDLNGWKLVSTVGGESFTFRFFRLAAGATVTLTSGEGARSLLPEVYLWTTSEVWADKGDAGELRDAQGRLRARSSPDGGAP